MTEPKLARKVRGKGRHYEHPITGELIPSVTNVIGILDKPALPRWSAKMVAEQAWKMRHSLDALGEAEAIDVLKGSPWRNSGRAADRGTSIHGYLEAIAEGREPPVLEGDAVRYRKAADDFLVRYRPEFIHTEFTVFGNGYAGTADAMVIIGGRLLIADYKTSKALYPEVALQLAAIRHADLLIGGAEEWYEMAPVDGCVGVLLTPDGCRVREIDAGPEAREAFMACLAVWRWRMAGSPLGAELEPETKETS